MDDFSLADTFHDLYNSTTISDPRELADELLKRIPEDCALNALRLVLPTWVRVKMNGNRNASQNAIITESLVSRPTNPTGASWKVDGIRRLLASRVSIGGQWKQLGDCGRSDLVEIAKERRDNAKRSLAKAKFYDSVASSLDAYRVKLVRDLPGAVLAELKNAADEGGDNE